MKKLDEKEIDKNNKLAKVSFWEMLGCGWSR